MEITGEYTPIIQNIQRKILQEINRGYISMEKISEI